MFRLSLASLVSLVVVSSLSRAGDEFDLYLNATIHKLTSTKNVRQVEKVTSDDLIDNDQVLPNLNSTFLVVKTNAGRNAKLVVQEARQRVDAESFLPMILVDRYITYREGEERTILAEGKRVALFAGFRLSLDHGQIVPEKLGGDLRIVEEKGDLRIEPVGKAKLFLVTKPLKGLADTTKGPKVEVGEKFKASYFNGAYMLHDDGRRSGKLVLKVHEDNTVTGALYSSKDGSKYEVRGKLGMPLHQIEFTVQFPRTLQRFRGWLFTGDARVLAGWAVMVKRESGFYAERIVE